MSKQYIKLPKLNGQKVRKKYYVSQVFEGHPAKGDIPMMIWILEEFLKDGEIVLDPMAGIGTTLLEGMRLFPNSLFIGIELEYKFVKWANASIKKTERIARQDWFMEIGKAVCVQGDARNLQRVMKKKVDKIISSPLFGGQVQHKTNYLGKQKQESGFEYSEDPENIGNLPQGKIDKIVTSPPYSETRMDGGKTARKRGGFKPYTDEPPDTWRTQRDQRNIGNLPHGKFDKIITSPPFGQAQSGGGIAKKGYTGDKHSPQDVGKYSYTPENVGQEKGNISNLPYVDKVISSPPYEQTTSPFLGGALIPEDKGPHIGCRNIRNGYTKDRNNLGNTKGKTYLEAMLLVYQQCFKVLKPDGLMVLITKDFIRNYKRVHLGGDTLNLCQMAGFKYIHTYHRKIDNPSFWRNDYYKKHPEVEQIDCEDILVLKK